MSEAEALQEYIQKHKIEELVFSLTEGLLRNKPDKKPKEYWMEMLKKELDADPVAPATVASDTPQAEVRRFSKPGVTVPRPLLLQLFEATKSIASEIVPKESIRRIMTETKTLLACDRVSLFVLDRRTNMLTMFLADLPTPIRVKPGQGISGTVFVSQEVINIPDCYQDPRFDQTFDQKSGYHTKSLLTMPIPDFEDGCMGVLQVINKEGGGVFTDVDEQLLSHLVVHVAQALRNAEVYRDAITTSERGTALLSMMQSLSQDLGAQSMILGITTHAKNLVQADKCTVFVVDETKGTLWSMSTDTGEEISIPKTKGVAGECATGGSLINIPDAYEDPRFNQEVDKTTGYRTQSILAVPIVGKSRPTPLAVIQMINKIEFDGETGRFDEEDEQVMEAFATFAASKIEQSSLLDAGERSQKTEAQEAFGGFEGRSAPKPGDREAAVIEEGDEEEDDG